MAKLVVLTSEFKGRSYELATVLTTVGRVEDNSFQIPEPSVSSHHCEIMLRGNDIIVKDLNSTNGTFLNGEQITGEKVVKSGQTLRLGQVEVRVQDDNAPAAPASSAASNPTAPAPAAAPAAQPKKQMDQTMVLPQGVKLNDLDQQGTRAMNSPFAKKTNKGPLILIAAIGGILVILGVIFWLISSLGGK